MIPSSRIFFFNFVQLGFVILQLESETLFAPSVHLHAIFIIMKITYMQTFITYQAHSIRGFAGVGGEVWLPTFSHSKYVFLNLHIEKKINKNELLKKKLLRSFLPHPNV